ncbi:hypothetical protein HaLaN_19069 [Haematococcus lacustris]|uniref:Uncharacterized protein n=1 Tax=Haematococcus lacustris TaxID=44745 RepID=A0A699ZHK0_HAELA|nr:hypothetical protein HaLaN_19069 [Haematococcus lacustris]
MTMVKKKKKVLSPPLALGPVAAPAPLPKPATTLAQVAALAGVAWASQGHHMSPRTGASNRLLQADRNKRSCTCPGWGFQPSSLVGLLRSSSASQGWGLFKIELTLLVLTAELLRRALDKVKPSVKGAMTSRAQPAAPTKQEPKPAAVAAAAAVCRQQLQGQ